MKSSKYKSQKTKVRSKTCTERIDGIFYDMVDRGDLFCEYIPSGDQAVYGNLFLLANTVTTGHSLSTRNREKESKREQEKKVNEIGRETDRE